MKKMKKIYLLISLITLNLEIQTINCLAQGNWTQKADCIFGGDALATFSIGNNGYMLQYPNHFFEWNKNSDTWIGKSNFPGPSRGGSVGFSIGTKGYVFGGQEYGNFYNDLWEWDQQTDTWTQKADKGGDGREAASAFSIGNLGYVVGGYTGLNTSIPELWEWDQSTNSWAQKASCPSGNKEWGVAFSIGTKGYFGTGGLTKDFWEWDQANNTWIQKADFGGGLRSSATGFSIGTKGYIGTGQGQYPTQFSDFWEWDQSTNTWTQKTNLPNKVRYGAIGFTINDKGYVGAGTYHDTATGLINLQKNFLEFDPTCNLPQVPSTTNATICANNTASLTATGSGTLGWYNQAIDGTYLGGGANYNTPILTTTTTYYVQDSTCAASASRKAVLVTVNPLPTITASASATNVCEGNPVTLTGGGASSYTWSGGVTNGLGFVPTTTTTYTVTGKDGNNCSNTAPKTINVNLLPTVTANASATTVCEGTSVTLTGGGASSYIWTEGITNGLGFVPANTTTYTVTGTDGNNCSNTTTKTINVNPLPTVTANASATSVCAGTSVILTGGGAASYTWSGGVTNGLSFVPSITTTYTVTGTDGNICSNTATKTVHVNPLPTVTANASAATVCAGTSVILTGGGASSYNWSDGISDGLGFVPATTNNYTVTGTDGNNCSNTAAKTVHVKPLPDITTNLSGLTISANQNGAIYQWLNCNNANSPIADAINQSYTASINGNYAVVITMNNCSDTSNCLNITTTGIEKLITKNNQLRIFPNPSKGLLTIQSTMEGVYTLRTESGQTIQSFKLNSTNNYTINIENLSNGIYFIVGSNNNQMTNQKVVVSK